MRVESLRGVTVAVAGGFLCLLGSLGVPASADEIVFVSNRDGNYEIYKMDDDGTNQARMTTTTSVQEHGPHFCPDGRIVFYKLDGGDYDIFIMDNDGSDVQNLTSGSSADDFLPDCSENSSEITFLTTRDGDYEIYKMSDSGSGQSHVTTTNEGEEFPSWLHRTGTNVVYDKFTGGLFHIYKIDPDGTDTVELTDDVDCLEPDGSPNGLKIAFLCNEPGYGFELCTVRPNGTQFTRLTTNTAAEGRPSWNSSSSALVFARQVSGYWELHRIDSNGSNEAQLTEPTNYDDLEPDWR
jgi:Tol biopolymer transport system component